MSRTGEYDGAWPNGRGALVYVLQSFMEGMFGRSGIAPKAANWLDTNDTEGQKQRKKAADALKSLPDL